MTALSACSSPAGDCNPIDLYAVEANITDSISGTPLGYRASLIVRDGAYVDSVSSSDDPADSARTHFLAAGLDRDGTYQVTVRREGWRVWTRQDVQVSRDGCGVLNSAELTVRLQRTQ